MALQGHIIGQIPALKPRFIPGIPGIKGAGHTNDYLKLRSMYFSQKQAVWVMSIMSIVNSISRVASGWLADRKWINRRVLFCVAYFVAACAITALYLWRSYWLLMFTCIVFSVSAGNFSLMFYLFYKYLLICKETN